MSNHHTSAQANIVGITSWTHFQLSDLRFRPCACYSILLIIHAVRPSLAPWPNEYHIYHTQLSMLVLPDNYTSSGLSGICHFNVYSRFSRWVEYTLLWIRYVRGKKLVAKGEGDELCQPKKCNRGSLNHIRQASNNSDLLGQLQLRMIWRDSTATSIIDCGDESGIEVTRPGWVRSVQWIRRIAFAAYFLLLTPRIQSTPPASSMTIPHYFPRLYEKPWKPTDRCSCSCYVLHRLGLVAFFWSAFYLLCEHFESLSCGLHIELESNHYVSPFLWM